MIIGSLVLDGIFLSVLAINILFAYSAYFGLWSGGFVLVFAGFAGIGGYTLAVAATRGGFSPILGVLTAAILAALLAVAMATPLRRVDGIYLGIVSIGFVVLCQSVESNWASLTGGSAGLTVPLEASVSSTALTLAAVLAVIGTYLLERSTLGLVLKSKRVDSLLSDSLGVNNRRLWLGLLIVSAVTGSVAGALRVGWIGYVSPTDHSFALLVTIIAMVILGGGEHWSGPLVGAVVFTVLNEFLQEAGEWAAIINGCVLLFVVLLAPAGIAGSLRTSLIRMRARRSRARAQAETARISPGDSSRHSSRENSRYVGSAEQSVALSVHNLNWQVGSLRVTDDVSLDLYSGQICGLIGPNGSGKSSLLNLLSGFVVPDSGQIVVDSEDMTNYRAFQFARNGVFRTFQGVRLMERETALDNVSIAAWRQRGNAEVTAPRRLWDALRSPRNRIRERAPEVLDRVGAAEFSGWLGGDVSYGTRRKIELARAILPGPKVLLLDEVTSGVSGEHIELMKRVITDEADLGCAVLIVDHDLDVISAICDRVIVIDAGAKIFDGPVEEAFLNTKVQEAYVGA